MTETTFEIVGSCGPIRGEAYRPENSRGTVVICHGFKGFGRGHFFPHVARELNKASLTGITFDFSGSGVGADRLNFTEPDRFYQNTFTKELDDLGRVIAHAQSQKWIGKRLGLFGHSRGGGTAILHAAADDRVAALVTWAAVSSVTRWPPEAVAEWRRRGFTEIENSRTHQVFKIGTGLLDETQQLGATKLNIEAAASRIKVPWLIVHGRDDETVPPAEAEQLHDVSKAHSTLRILPGSHGFDGKHPLTEVPPALEAVTSETVSFFARHLGAT